MTEPITQAYPDGTGVTTTTYEADSVQSLKETIVETVAAHRGIARSEIHSADTDALDQLVTLFDGQTDLHDTAEVSVSFMEVVVSLTGAGKITVRSGENRAVIVDEEGFEAALVRLIRAAEANGVEVGGGWVCRDDLPFPNWGIEIIEVV